MHDVVFCLMGPTASGKTALACEWVSLLPCEIISVDSAMIYQGMDIGTAKPDQATLNVAPHHLIDICQPTACYSAAQFCHDAWTLINDIRRRGKIPLLVGGTMMYFRALQQGLSTLPEADDVTRAMLVEQHAQHGQAFMHAWLMRVDPVSASRIHPHDTQRTQRALEVYCLTGTPLSDYLAQKTHVPQATFVNMSLFPARRAWLHERILMRFDLMLNEGFVDEVAQLIAQWALTPEHPSMRSVGYRQALGYVQGHVDYMTFYQQGVAATRQLAKRQLTWLRSWPDVQHYDPEDAQCMARVIANAAQIVDN